MQTIVTAEIREVIEAVHYRPAISIILPFEAKVNLKHDTAHALNVITDKLKRELAINYPEDLCKKVIDKLHNITENLDFDTSKKSIAIYVSPVFEKVLYLDFKAEEKIVVDESFEIRDLVFGKKQMLKYLLLIISGKETRIFLGSTEKYIKIATHTPENVFAYINDPPEKVANFSDANERKRIVLEKFLQHIDKSLENILNAYHLPLFVLAPPRVLGHFKKVSKHQNHVIEFIHGNFDKSSLQELKEIMEPHIEAWKKKHQADVIEQLDDAASQKKLVVGIRNVWREAMLLKGHLLVVEKDFMYAAQHAAKADQIYKPTEPINQLLYVKDAVDDVIEKVLLSGGDVEFVDNDVIKSYHHIALVLNY
jgi:hypothetical protein